MFGGCWDKSIWSWHREEGRSTKHIYKGHSDFVKAVICAKIGGKDVSVLKSAPSPCLANKQSV